MSAFVAEGIGTALLILMGNGVVANVVLKKTLGNQGGWIVITFGWAIAVFTGVLVAGPVSGGHLNPAVSIAMAVLGKITWSTAGQYIIAQLLGAMIGATLVYMSYRDHFAVTEDRGSKLGAFCTAPPIRNTFSNLFTEAVGTFVLVFVVLNIVSPEYKLGALDALPVGLIVLGLGLSLGGPTGYAINPARDLGPRIMHALLPIPDKRDSDWSYSWIPVI
ncbi:MAG: MIP/aquaporin family protein, partial [Saprospiraceae bacterium]